MTKVPTFDGGNIESMAKILGECGSGSDISRILAERGIRDDSEGFTKWRRLYKIFLEIQSEDKCANRILDFVQSFLARAMFIGKNDEFEVHRTDLNIVLALSGIEYGSDGKFRKVRAATTLAEAEQRANAIKAKFQGRRIHHEVLKYCRAELMEENYFHAVFEASKGLAQRIRDMSQVEADGSNLVDKVFSGDLPRLAFNTLRTETERSEHRGFSTLLKGCFATIRNPLAHEPKIMWEGEDDTADYLTLISLLHRKLDDCVSTKTDGIQ